MVSQADIQLYQGDDWAGIVTVMDGDAPASLSGGYLAQAQIRLGPADSWPTLVEMGAFVDPIVQGQINLSIPSASSTLLTCNYLWDLQLTAPSGVVTTLLAGRVLVTQEITREAA
jgi:hypothetical protein